MNKTKSNFFFILYLLISRRRCGFGSSKISNGFNKFAIHPKIPKEEQTQTSLNIGPLLIKEKTQESFNKTIVQEKQLKFQKIFILTLNLL